MEILTGWDGKKTKPNKANRRPMAGNPKINNSGYVAGRMLLRVGRETS
jgi:hypothetical protein